MISRAMARRGWWWSVGALALIVGVSFAVWTKRSRPPHAIHFYLPGEGAVLVNIHRADGVLVRRLAPAQRFPAGPLKLSWDGRSDDGAPVRAGDYEWRALWHAGREVKLRTWSTTLAAAAAEHEVSGDWRVPSAVAADAEKVYLGWSLADGEGAVQACDLEGGVQWAHRRAEGPSGCTALAVDAGVVYVLGGLGAADVEGVAIYRLDARTGQPVLWPKGNIDLKIASLWPPASKTAPVKADGMAVRHGRIYLTFTAAEFLTVLDAKTGAYLQTVVGAPPGLIDVAPTQTDLPEAPGKLVDADFALISLRGGVLGKVLFAHDPLWVVTSELIPLEREEQITALAVVGDGAKHHQHTAFVGLSEPFHQVQARPLLATDRFVWVAGQPGGRPPFGPWQAQAFRDIRGVALAADGRLWVAEGEAYPRRFSVWETGGTQGKLAREIFAPLGPLQVAHPLDPAVIFAEGCEWRKSNHLECLGVVLRERVARAAYGVSEDGKVFLFTSARQDGEEVRILERSGDGAFEQRDDLMRAEDARFLPGGTIRVPAKL